jgi:hypothetical protein
MYAIGLTVHNQEAIIKQNVLSILNNCSYLTKELIINLDGCTDESGHQVLEAFYEYNKNIDTKRILSPIKVTIIQDNNVFETKANNHILQAVDQPYCILVQDDCEISEKFFDMRLAEPMRQFDNVFAVSGRNSHNLDFFKDELEIFYPDCCGAGTYKNRGDIFYMRQVVNRGPLALRMDVVKKLNYFDEIFVPQNQDDHDLCIRAYLLGGYRCGSYAINFFSNPSDGGTRKPEAANWIYPAIQKNWGIMRERYENLYKNVYNVLPRNEERIVVF